MKKRRRPEYKKIVLALILIWSAVYISLSGIFGVNEGVSQAMIYAVVGSYLGYCLASASDKRSANRYGVDIGGEMGD